MDAVVYFNCGCRCPSGIALQSFARAAQGVERLLGEPDNRHI